MIEPAATVLHGEQQTARSRTAASRGCRTGIRCPRVPGSAHPQTCLKTPAHPSKIAQRPGDCCICSITPLPTSVGRGPALSEEIFRSHSLRSQPLRHPSRARRLGRGRRQPCDDTNDLPFATLLSALMSSKL